MKAEQHKTASEKHYEIAVNIDKEFKNEADKDKRLSLMTVAAQNYFYAAINAVEYVFAKMKNSLHSGNHENRTSNIYTNIKEFKNSEMFFEYKKMQETRGMVTYRAVNGEKYKIIKIFAKIANDELK